MLPQRDPFDNRGAECARVVCKAAFVAASAALLGGCTLWTDGRPPKAVADAFAQRATKGCDDQPGDPVLAISAAIPDGEGEVQWWTAPAGDSSVADLITVEGDDHNFLAAHCTSLPRGDVGDGLSYFGGELNESLGYHAGTVPAGAIGVRLTFADQPPLRLDVNDRGYFLVVVDLAAWELPTVEPIHES